MAGPVGQDNTLNDPALIIPPPNFQEFMGDAGFSEVFDSLNWVFDGFPDSSFVAPPVM